MSLLTLDRVACAAPDGTILFQDLSLSIHRQIVGLVGRNGAGKTTLLRAIMGQYPVSSGVASAQGKIAFLDQLPGDAGARVEEALGISTIAAALARIGRGEGTTEDFAAADWTLPTHCEAALASVDLPQLDPKRSLATLSGGERTRVRLAALLLQSPDILLLDEPTNNLDDNGRAAVADLLSNWKGAALVASHDRDLLQRVDRIVELTPVGVHIVTGGWDEFDSVRQAERRRAVEAVERDEAQLKTARRERQRESEKQDRRDRHGRAVAAKGIDSPMFLHRQQQRAEKSAARYRNVGGNQVEQAAASLCDAQARVERMTPMRITLSPSGLAARHRLIEFTAITSEYDDRRIFGPLDLTVRGPERIALTGANGSGKSTLIRITTGLEPPASGEVWADTERLALLDQDLSLLAGATTLSGAVARENPDLTDHQVHQALANYGFRNRWADRAVDNLSGGERVRLALAAVFSRARPPLMLILDEPTNHLDLGAIELLENALNGFDGAILCVSHDAAFRTRLGLSRTIEL